MSRELVDFALGLLGGGIALLISYAIESRCKCPQHHRCARCGEAFGTASRSLCEGCARKELKP